MRNGDFVDEVARKLDLLLHGTANGTTNPKEMAQFVDALTDLVDDRVSIAMDAHGRNYKHQLREEY